MKKLILTICIFCFVFSFTASAEKAQIVKSIEPSGDFYVYSEHGGEVADILGMSESDLKEHCKQNGVAYLAVNKDNTKQIKVTHEVTDFSNSIININNLSDDSISALVPDITGIENAKGEVITKDGQKFILAQFKTADSGGEYILTQYITVAERTNIVLSFLTAATADIDYIEDTFLSFSSPLFVSETEENSSPVGYVLLAAAIIFGIACVVIVITIVKDIRKESSESFLTEEIEENDN